MSYLGRGLEQVDNISKLDNITFNGGTTYALTKDSAAFTPISSNALLVSIDGVIQQGNFSVSGTNIVFNFSPTGSNTCDFIMHYGTGVAFTPADSSITKDKTNFVSTSSAAGLEIKGDNTTDGTLQLNCRVNSHGIKLKSPPHSAGQSYTLTFPSTSPATDKIMQTDSSGNLSFVDAPSGGLAYVGGASVVATNTSQVNVDSVFSSTYRNYKIIIEATSNANTADIRMKLRDASGDITVSNEFYTVLFGGAQNGNVQAGTQTQDNYFRLFENTPSQDNADYPACCCEITIYAPYVSTDHTHMTFIGSYKHSGGEERTRYGSLLMKGQKTVTGLALVSSTGLINDAQIKVYGMVDS